MGRRTSSDIFYTLTGLLGLILIYFEILIFRKTIINVWIPLSIIFLFGLFTFLFTKGHYKKTYHLSGNFLPLLHSIVSLGLIACYIFMAANYYLSGERSVSKAKILKTGHLAKGRRGCANPYCEIKINGLEKQLIFPCGFDIDNSNTVILTVEKGFFGFDVVIDKDAIYEK
jgi:energy-coupling factor transporter transmembrane protein EcfT